MDFREGDDPSALSPSSDSSSAAVATTPPSSAESSPASKIRNRKRAGSFTVEADEFLGCLDNYVAVGSLLLSTQTECPLPTSNAWLKASSSWFEELGHRPDKTTSALETVVASRWARIFYKHHNAGAAEYTIRIYILPDDVGRKYLDRSSSKARNALKHVMSVIDMSTGSFQGFLTGQEVAAPQTSSESHESLFYVFNTLQSPTPDPARVSDVYSRGAVMDILEKDSLRGLKTTLYPYQKRSAAMMIQRECDPAHMLDPRYETKLGPTGQQYYYDGETGKLRREKIMYEEARGGILAETMGYGKTLICLAVILATKGHYPRIPAQYSTVVRTRERTGSLMEMVAAKIGASSIPWRPRLEQMESQGEHYAKCINACERNSGVYVIPPPPPRYGVRESKPAFGTEKRVVLCHTTLIIVPANLLVQWQQEIARHTESLRVLEVLHAKDKIPPAEQLLRYDIVLISKPRFEKESPDLDFFLEKTNAPDTVYRSPLMDLHWLRIIVDEGHSFALSGTRTNAVAVLDRLHVERRWIVSGTPSNGLMGVEVGLATNETSNDMLGSPEVNSHLALDARKTSIYQKEETKDLEKLRVIVQDFLKLQPWANSLGNDAASWSRYIMPFDKTGHKRKSTTSLRSTLNGLVVRHRIEDVEKDLRLPPLHNKVAYLQPSFYDKLSINLFIMVLASNAVTSERTDQDYMWHPKNKKQLTLLLSNLRQSGFWWVWPNSKDLDETLRIGKKYLEDNAGKILESDRDLLQDALSFGESAVSHPTWRAFTQFYELGIFIDDFPEFAREAWAMSSTQTHPLLLGAIETKIVQRKVNSQLARHEDPIEGLVGEGLRAMQDAKKRATAERDDKHIEPPGKLALAPDGTRLKGRKKPLQVAESSPTKSRIPFSPLKTEGTGANALVLPPISKSTGKVVIPPDSPLAKTRICGTASAKLTYLIGRVLQYQADEKIIIFYDGDNIAFWIAEALEVLGIQFLIYARTLTNARRATYLATFNQTESFRVLIMDLKQAAHGLHIACASRVFIVNPIWQPSVEAQAIKRAHRIGQTRPVFVETLVLKDTLEDKMLRRRKDMTNQELQRAEKSLLDDNTMSSIIQNERLIPISDEERTAYGQVAMLETSQRLFGREGRGNVASHPDENLVLLEYTPTSTPTLKAKRKIGFADDSDPIPLLESDAIDTPSRKKRTSVRLRVPSSAVEESDDGSISVVTPKKRTRISAPTKKVVAFDIASPRIEQDPSFPSTPIEQSTSMTTKPAHPQMALPFLLNETEPNPSSKPSTPPQTLTTELSTPLSTPDPTFLAPNISLFGGSSSAGAVPSKNVPGAKRSMAFEPHDADNDRNVLQ